MWWLEPLHPIQDVHLIYTLPFWSHFIILSERKFKDWHLILADCEDNYSEYNSKVLP
jgi:hypothetical protein